MADDNRNLMTIGHLKSSFYSSIGQPIQAFENTVNLLVQLIQDQQKKIGSLESELRQHEREFPMSQGDHPLIGRENDNPNTSDGK